MRGYVDGPFGQVHYRSEGEGAPLLLIHQALLSQRQFDAVYAPLAGHSFRAIGMDLPGYGQSDPPPSPPTIADYAKAAHALVDALGLEAVHILGHHTGAQVATEFALAWPEQTRSVILNGPLPMEESQRAAGLTYVETTEKDFSYLEDGSHLMRLYENRNAYRPADGDLAKATRYVAEAFMGLGPLWYGHHAAFTHDHGAAIARLSCKTLILTNTGDELYPNAQATKAQRPDFSYAEIEGGGIDIVDEAPAAWVEAVVSFTNS
ncbi:MAG: alpha/beta hydrolase [Pseudomonadota bacterium]